MTPAQTKGSKVNIQELTEAIEKANGARFASATYLAKSSGELARHTLIIGANYGKVVADSQLALSLVDLAQAAEESKLPLSVFELAKAELEKSLTDSATGFNPAYTKNGLYRTVSEGVKVSLNDGTFELAGLQHAKRVIVPGFYPTVKSAPKTIAKNILRKMLPLGRYRTLALDAGHIASVRANGEEIEFLPLD